MCMNDNKNIFYLEKPQAFYASESISKQTFFLLSDVNDKVESTRNFLYASQPTCAKALMTS